MMALLFLIALLAGVLAWFGQRRYAIYTLSVLLVLSLLMFAHHMTSTLTIQL